MDSGAWKPTIHGIVESDMTEWLALSSKRKKKNLVFVLFSGSYFLDKELLNHKDLECPAKCRYNSNYITACICVLIIKEENEKDA